MEIKLRIIEFSSDIFSSSNQLKDLSIIPLFSSSNFVINIYEAISQNKEYIFFSKRHILKLGLFNGKSLLGTGRLNPNKFSQKIEFTEDNQVIKNNYFLTIECIINNNFNKNNNDNNNYKIYEKKRNNSVDNYQNKKDLYLSKSEKKKYSKNKINFIDKNIKSKRNYNNLKGNMKIVSENGHKLCNNSFIIQSHNNIKHFLFSRNNNNDRNENNNYKNSDLLNLSNKIIKSSDEVINISYLSNNENNFTQSDNVLFESLFKNFNDIIKNKYFSKKNKSGFIIDYKCCLEKIVDFFKLYARISNDIIEQNQNLKKYIKLYHHLLKMILKKDNLLKIKYMNLELKNKNNLAFDYEVRQKNINNKFLLIKNISNDYFSLWQNNINKRKTKLQEIYRHIINNKLTNYEHKKYIGKIINDKMNSNNYEFSANKIDLDKFKNKIDKLKQQYLNETSIKNYKNKNNIKTPKRNCYKDKNIYNSNIKMKKTNLTGNKNKSINFISPKIV